MKRQREGRKGKGREEEKERGKSVGGKGERMGKRKENSFSGQIMACHFWVCTFQFAQWLKKRLLGQGKVSENKNLSDHRQEGLGTTRYSTLKEFEGRDDHDKFVYCTLFCAKFSMRYNSYNLPSNLGK